MSITMLILKDKPTQRLITVKFGNGVVSAICFWINNR